MDHQGLKQLPAQIREELHCSETLLACLQAEQALLTHMQLENLPEQAARKQQALDRLQQATTRRLASLRAAGFDSLDTLEKRFRMPQALQTQIRQLRQNIEQAQALNAQNGLLIQRGMAVNQQLVQILGGQLDDTQDPPPYAPGGQKSSASSSLLGEA